MPPSAACVTGGGGGSVTACPTDEAAQSLVRRVGKANAGSIQGERDVWRALMSPRAADFTQMQLHDGPPSFGFGAGAIYPDDLVRFSARRDQPGEC